MDHDYEWATFGRPHDRSIDLHEPRRTVTNRDVVLRLGDFGHWSWNRVEVA